MTEYPAILVFFHYYKMNFIYFLLAVFNTLLQDELLLFLIFVVVGVIIKQGCKTKVGLRNILCLIQKKQKGWWKRLLETEEKPAPYLKVDWNKWCDEDEEESTCKLICILHALDLLVGAFLISTKIFRFWD